MSQQDTAFMQQAITVGERGRYTAPPNPWVGCVIVANGEVVGEGYHVRPGESHAEPAALVAAGGRARGATAYVTLEPCSHHGKTPPCADALVRAGVARVVVGVEDPDPLVAGKGMEKLKAAGIEVVVGVEHEAVSRSLRPYLHHRRTGRPFFWMKAAVSVDGRIAAEDGTSQWITTEEARSDVQKLRAESQAVLVGAGTAQADNPQLTVRDDALKVDRQPLRVLVDGRGRTPAQGHLADMGHAPTLVATAADADPTWIAAWEACGCEVWRSPSEKGPGRVHLTALAEELAKRGVLQVLVEGGSGIYGSLWAASLVDHITCYVGPRLLGATGLPLLPIEMPSIAAAPILELESCEKLGQSIRLDYTQVPTHATRRTTPSS